MTQSTQKALASKWLLIVQEYELVKRNRSTNFTHIRQICNAFKVTRRDIRKDYTRWTLSGRQTTALLPQKRGPKPGTLKILSKDEERTIVQIHRRLRAHPFEIYYLLENRFRLHPSVSTIYRTLKRYPFTKKRIDIIKRYERQVPGELVHADTTYLDRKLFTDRKRRCLLGVIDDCTRLCYVQLVERMQAVHAVGGFFQAGQWFAAHGIPIREVLTDNGSEFTTYTSRTRSRDTHSFEILLQMTGIRHRYTRPYRPQTNGKIERFWRTLKEECFRRQTQALTPRDFEAELNGFLYRYNYQRRHSALGYGTPLDKLKAVTEMVT